MKRIFVLLLINSFLYGSGKILKREDTTYSSFHAQGTITNTTDAEISILFLHQSHIHNKRIHEYISEWFISDDKNVQPNQTLEIDKDATSVLIRTTEFRPKYSSTCMINPNRSYSIQKSDVLMLVDEATNEIILDRRYYR